MFIFKILDLNIIKNSFLVTKPISLSKSLTFLGFGSILLASTTKARHWSRPIRSICSECFVSMDSLLAWGQQRTTLVHSNPLPVVTQTWHYGLRMEVDEASLAQTAKGAWVHLIEGISHTGQTVLVTSSDAIIHESLKRIDYITSFFVTTVK